MKDQLPPWTLLNPVDACFLYEAYVCLRVDLSISPCVLSRGVQLHGVGTWSSEKARQFQEWQSEQTWGPLPKTKARSGPAMCDKVLAPPDGLRGASFTSGDWKWLRPAD